MQAKEEGEEGRSEMEECPEILHTVSSETLETSVIFHVVKEIVGFILYMHHQIPAILQDITLEYDAMRTECKDLGSILSEPEVKSSCRRKHNGRMREVKQGIKKLDKLMNSFSSIQTALQSILNETHDIERVILVLGASPIRPQHVYEIHFLHGRVATDNEKDYVKSRAADTLSRKAIRALISNGAGSVSYAGPTKLFLLVKAPATLNLPLHFLPKRDFKYSKKIVPFRVSIKCKVTNQDILGVAHHASESTGAMSFPYSTSHDLICNICASCLGLWKSQNLGFFFRHHKFMDVCSGNVSTIATLLSRDLQATALWLDYHHGWFQCRHTIKGLPSRAPLPEE